LKFDIHEDADRFLVIESVTNSSSKTIHVINFGLASTVKVGRGSQCEVRITDVSVSRHHSTLELVSQINSEGKQEMHLIVSDEQSKFGTLVFIRKPIKLAKGVKSYVQVGRTLLAV